MAKNSKGQETNDQRINKSGRGKSLSVGKLLPANWDMVRVTRTKQADHEVWLHIRQLEVIEAE